MTAINPSTIGESLSTANLNDSGVSAFVIVASWLILVFVGKLLQLFLIFILITWKTCSGPPNLFGLCWGISTINKSQNFSFFRHWTFEEVGPTKTVELFVFLFYCCGQCPLAPASSGTLKSTTGSNMLTELYANQSNYREINMNW
jgi:hypothetical protein